MARNPFDDLEQLFDRMEAQLEGRAGVGTTSSVALDLLDQEDAYVVRADLPGFDADDLDLTYADGTLELSARRTEVDVDGEFVRRERSTSAERSVTIPQSVDAEAIEASFEDGVLTVTLPKKDPDDAGRRIEIE